MDLGLDAIYNNSQKKKRRNLTSYVTPRVELEQKQWRILAAPSKNFDLTEISIFDQWNKTSESTN